MRRSGLLDCSRWLEFIVFRGTFGIRATWRINPKVVNDGHGDFLYVPAGPFKMGDNFGDGMPRERPVHTVDLDAFYIGKFEVTNAEWKAFRDSLIMTMRRCGQAIA